MRSVTVSSSERWADASFRSRARLQAIAIGDRLLREGSRDVQHGDRDGFGYLSPRGLEGPAGFALFYDALSHLTGESPFAGAMHDSLRSAALADDVPGVGLFGGISGLRAAAAIATRGDLRYTRLAAQCDAFVESQLPKEFGKPESFRVYDVISGWSGARLARCIRGPRDADRFVECIVRTLEDPQRWCCAHPSRGDEPPQNDLGLAHGVAGMLAALSLTLDPLKGRAAAAAHDALAYLLEQRVGRGSHHAWPSSAPALVQDSYRSGWCYGAAGVLSAIHSTAVALGDVATIAFAINAMERLAVQPVASWSLANEALCHGLMGNALCFASVASAGGSAELWAVALRVATEGMDSLDESGGRCWTRAPDMNYDAVGILTGVCGIGLALLTLSGDADPSWMRLFGLRPIA